MAYGLGSNGGYTIRNEYNYKKPKVVPKLVYSPSAYESSTNNAPYAEADEILSTGDYYDGERKLNSVIVGCTVYAFKKDCLHNSKCGWCGQFNKCVTGNNLGPLEPCDLTTYSFTTATTETRSTSVQNVGPLAIAVQQFTSK